MFLYVYYINSKPIANLNLGRFLNYFIVPARALSRLADDLSLAPRACMWYIFLAKDRS
ncbi:MAG: hypothetical protein WC552_04325 [Candidatus Omnitrophota bacterium]